MFPAFPAEVRTQFRRKNRQPVTLDVEFTQSLQVTHIRRERHKVIVT